ncbi:HIT family protein [Actinomadura viridis]|uniref:HIT family protein n=1 Tax=Actinomadura viridis TaxID=58110 RepID=UPI0036A65BD3
MARQETPRATGAEEGERDCVLCPPLRFRLNEMADLPGESAVLADDGGLFLMPDLAPLADGHVLLVTALHHQCAGAFGEDLWAGAWRWRRRVGRIYRAAYGREDLVMFEHGPGTPQGGGACVDHAHWHLLPHPSGGGMRALLEERGLGGRVATRESVREYFRTGRSYLLLEEEGAVTVHPGEGVPSQYLRWVAKKALGLHGGTPGARQGAAYDPEPQIWRWQEQFGLPASRARFLRTLERLRAAMAQDETGEAQDEAEGEPEEAEEGGHPGARRVADHQKSSPAASRSPNPIRSTPSP